MEMDDLNNPQDPVAPQEPTPQPEPQAQQIDVNTAYDVIAQAEGWDPRLTRYEIQELKRKRDAFDREKSAFETERKRQYEIPNDDTSDPYLREMRETRRMIMEDREEKKRERETEAATTRIANEMNSLYSNLARQNGMTMEQMNSRADEFYGSLIDLYPSPAMILEIGTERAARAAFRQLGQSNGRNPSYNPQINGRGPTATRTISGSPQPFIPGGGNPLPPEDNLSSDQLPGENDQQYEARLRRIIEGANVRRLPDGMKVQSR